MHELTYKRIKQEERYFKEFVRVGREQGLLIDPVAYYDEQTQSSKVDTKFYSYGLKLFFESLMNQLKKKICLLSNLIHLNLIWSKNLMTEK